MFFKQHRDRVLRIINFAWLSDQKRDFNIDRGQTCLWAWTEGDWWLWGTFTKIPHPGRTWGEWRPVTTVKESRGNTVSYMEKDRLNEWIVNEHLLWVKTKDRHSHPTPTPIWLYNTSQPNSRPSSLILSLGQPWEGGGTCCYAHIKNRKTRNETDYPGSMCLYMSVGDRSQLFWM